MNICTGKGRAYQYGRRHDLAKDKDGCYRIPRVRLLLWDHHGHIGTVRS